MSSISKRFDSTGGLVLDGLSLEVHASEFVAVVGASGSGKSTLLNTLGLLDRPDAGSYRVNGTEVLHLNDRAQDVIRRESLGFVFQSSHLFDDLTVHENISFGLRQAGADESHSNARASTLAQALSLQGKATDAARYLSGGERQRVAVARAMAGNPSFILADEPTGNLDSANTERVVDLFREYCRQGGAIVVVTHDLGLAALADRVLELREGRLETVSYNSGSSIQAEGNSLATVDDSTPLVLPRPVQRRTSVSRFMSRLQVDVTDAILGLGGLRFRSVLLIAAFAVATGALALSAGVSGAAAQAIDTRIQNAGSQLVTIHLPTDQELLAQKNGQLDDWMARARSLTHVRSVNFASLTGANTVPMTQRVPGLQTESARMSPAIATVSSGILAEALGEAYYLSENSVVVPRGVAESLGLGAVQSGILEPGHQLWVGGRQLDILAIHDGTVGVPGLSDSVIVSRSHASSLNLDEFRLIVEVDHGHAEAIAAALLVALSPESPGLFIAQAVPELHSLRQAVGDDLRGFVSLISVLVFCLACAGAGVAMFTSVNSRRSEISLRRALGSSKQRVGGLFVMEGAIAGLVGGMVGISLASATLFVVFAGTIQVNAIVIGAGCLGGLLAGVTSALIPAWIAAHRPPSLGLRE